MTRLAKTKTAFVCQNCGFQSVKWIGKCPDCQGWNTLVEEEVLSKPRSGIVDESVHPVTLDSVAADEQERMRVEIGEYDRVLGGGVVRGGVVLIGGDPGIGKSTIALQMSHHLSQRGHRVLYVSGEESVRQTKMRADRLGVAGQAQFYIVNATDLEAILGFVKKTEPDILVVDSIQVVYTPALQSSSGSVGQVRECAGILTQLAKRSGMSVFLIGHVTKEGTIAGPRVLEHIVDTVLYFEGERFSNYRILRAIKNRFGSTNEIGVFEMTSEGLREVANPSEIFLSERPHEVPGSVVTPMVEGSRPVLVEIQALVARANIGMVRRRAEGFDYNRLGLLAAVLEKRMGWKLYDQDIFVNVVGGMKIADPAMDLGICLAIASSFHDRLIPFDTLAVGEVGLAAEIRSVTNIAIRLNEAKKMGFKRVLLPRANDQALKAQKIQGITLVPVEDLKAAVAAVWGNI